MGPIHRPLLIQSPAIRFSTSFLHIVFTIQKGFAADCPIIQFRDATVSWSNWHYSTRILSQTVKPHSSSRQTVGRITIFLYKWLVPSQGLKIFAASIPFLVGEILWLVGGCTCQALPQFDCQLPMNIILKSTKKPLHLVKPSLQPINISLKSMEILIRSHEHWNSYEIPEVHWNPEKIPWTLELQPINISNYPWTTSNEIPMRSTSCAPFLGRLSLTQRHWTWTEQINATCISWFLSNYV